ncbi:hypothetical protein GAYE_SCF43G5675 [Galdieria yellowstonensis]|uniref:BZIP domain-containing protein n=1 Tax=Galdieria yellowstonensis TaxID=3028027 RepID=A0AAV9IKA8_9RHOD|nr:hypothetical protein GAYE_SCF43G5675 [Galdieria yellowstonensis]
MTIASFLSWSAATCNSSPFRSSFTAPLCKKCACRPTPSLPRVDDDTFSRQVVSMKGRRDLKKEKKLRNLEFARLHRKKKERKRKVNQETLRVMDDNNFVREVFSASEESSSSSSE